MGAGIFLDGHFGNYRDAHTCADHVQQAGELAALENHLRMDVRAAAGGNGSVAKAVAITEKQKRVGAEVVQGKRAAGSELVIRWERRAEALRGQQRGIKIP